MLETILVDSLEYYCEASENDITLELLEHEKNEYKENNDDVPNQFNIQKVNCEGVVYWRCEFIDVETNWESCTTWWGKEEANNLFNNPKKYLKKLNDSVGYNWNDEFDEDGRVIKC